MPPQRGKFRRQSNGPLAGLQNLTACALLVGREVHVMGLKLSDYVRCISLEWYIPEDQERDELDGASIAACKAGIL